MKKIIVILTVLAMVLCFFAGCGSSGSKDISGSISQLPSEAPETPETPELDEAKFETGFVVGGTYSNEFLGINLTLDSNWVYYNEEQIAELNGFSIDHIGDEEIKNMLENSGAYFDLFASTLDSTCTINISIENVGLVNSLLSEEDVVDASIDTTVKALESAGFSNVASKKISVDFCGKEHAAISTQCVNPYGVELSQLQVMYKVGTYIACITFSASDENTCYELADLFYTGEPIYAPAEPQLPAEPEVPAEPELPVYDGEFCVGTIDGNSYINPFFGFACELNDDWYMYDVYDLAEYNGISGGAYSTQDALDLMALGDTPYDMSAVTYDENFYIEVIIEDLGDLYGLTLSPEDYIDITLPDFEEAYAIEFDSLQCTKEFVDFCGEKHPAIVVKASTQGVDIYQTMICTKSGNYIGIVSLLAFYEDATGILASYFSPIY